MGLWGAVWHRKCGMQIGQGMVLKVRVREGFLELKAPMLSLKE